jgi:hypothetical protein
MRFVNNSNEILCSRFATLQHTDKTGFPSLPNYISCFLEDSLETVETRPPEQVPHTLQIREILLYVY